MVLKVGMLVQLFAIVHGLHSQKCSSQKHLLGRVSNGVLGRGDGGSHGQACLADSSRRFVLLLFPLRARLQCG